MNTFTSCGYEVCTRTADEGDWNIGNQYVNWFSRAVTIQDFEKKCNVNGIALTNLKDSGSTFLCLAAFKCNVAIIKYIVNLNGKELLSIGNYYGWTPLFCAAWSDDFDHCYEAGKALIELGADVNLASCIKCGEQRRANIYISENELTIPAHATPLWIAATKTINLRLIRILLKHGAVANPPLEGLNALRVELIRNDIYKVKLLLRGLIDPKSIFTFLPKEIIKIILVMNLSLD